MLCNVTQFVSTLEFLGAETALMWLVSWEHIPSCCKAARRKTFGWAWKWLHKEKVRERKSEKDWEALRICLFLCWVNILRRAESTRTEHNSAESQNVSSKASKSNIKSPNKKCYRSWEWRRKKLAKSLSPFFIKLFATTPWAHLCAMFMCQQGWYIFPSKRHYFSRLNSQPNSQRKST